MMRRTSLYKKGPPGIGWHRVVREGVRQWATRPTRLKIFCNFSLWGVWTGYQI